MIMDNGEMWDSSGFAIPEALKQRLSTLWIKCLHMLSLSTLPTISIQVMLNDARLRQGMTLNSKAESWEEILVALTEEDAVVKHGDLKLQPIFCNLPPVLQTRFLHLVQCNASKICSHYLNAFVTKLESAELVKSSWPSNYISMIRQSLHAEKTREGPSISPKLASYKFCTASETFINNLTMNHGSDRAKFANSAVTTITTVSQSNPSVQGETGGNTSKKVIDVIVIDDGGEVTQVISNVTSREGNISYAHPPSKEMQGSLHCVDGDHSVKKNVNDMVLRLSDLSSSANASSAREHKHRVTTSKEECMSMVATAAVISISDDDSEPVLKAPKLDVQAQQTSTPVLDEPKKDLISEATSLSEHVKALLLKLRESYFGDNKGLGTGSSDMRFLLDLSLSELQCACNYLKLSDQTEDSLINFMDVVPWSELEHDLACILLAGCLFKKVTTSQSQISQPLLTSILPVLKDHPQAVLDLLIKAVNNNQSNEVQCQLLATLCKDALSQEWLCYLVKQLEGELVVDVDANQLAVLQVVIDRRPDLDPLGLTSVLALLARSSQGLGSCPRLGKCMMAYLTKYGKKMTADDLATFSSLLDTHGSNFKTALKASFKRLNK